MKTACRLPLRIAPIIAITVVAAGSAQAFPWPPNQPFVCMDGDPAPYPSHDRWTCEWQPDSPAAWPWRVTACDFTNMAPSDAQIYSEENLQGLCARVHGYGNFTPFRFTTQFISYYGWWSSDTYESGPHRIKSVKIGANTSMMLCEGELNANDACNGSQINIQTLPFSQPLGLTALTVGANRVFTVYSFILRKTQ